MPENEESMLNLSDMSSSTETEDVTQNIDTDTNEAIHSIEDKDKFRFFVQYRGKATDELAQKLHQINAPCRIVMTLRKLKTMIPLLKPPVTSNVVYQITCLRCKACYVGATTRNTSSLCDNDVMILGCNNREDHLFTLEALFQHEIRPKINGKEEFRTKTLSILF